MDFYHTTDMHGVSEINPDTRRMREMLDELDKAENHDAPHLDVSLIHHGTGWALTVYPSGVVTLENLDEADEMPRYLRNVTRREALAMWIDLSNGHIDQVNSRSWVRDKI